MRVVTRNAKNAELVLTSFDFRGERMVFAENKRGEKTTYALTAMRDEYNGYFRNNSLLPGFLSATVNCEF